MERTLSYKKHANNLKNFFSALKKKGTQPEFSERGQTTEHGGQGEEGRLASWITE